MGQSRDAKTELIFPEGLFNTIYSLLASGSELLEEIGYEVRACSGFADALGYLGRDRFKLAVVDLSLSGEVLSSRTFASDRTHDGYRVLRCLSTFPSQSQHSEHTSSLRAFCSSVRSGGTYLAHTWCLLRSSVTIIYLVDCPKSSSCAM